MTDKPLSYDEVWDELRAGRLSVSVLAHLMRVDEVFRAWCIRKHDAEKRRQMCGNDPSPTQRDRR